MDVLALILFTVGLLASAAGGIWYLVAAFKKGTLWGLGNLFVPFVGLAFLVVHPREAWKPFAVNLAGLVLIGGAAALYIPAHPEMSKTPLDYHEVSDTH